MSKIRSETFAAIKQRGYLVDHENGLLGVGGSSVVIKAKALSNNRRVAIKILLDPNDSLQA